MKDENNLVILDTRNENELSLEKKELSNFINIPYKELNNRIEEIIEYKDKQMLIVGLNGGKAYKAALLLSDYGFKNLVVIQGGSTEFRIPIQES